ncbi:diaminopimelate decarboxylase [bacterium]|nr:diaminopimelate decarboxylase [bacterium]
MSHLSHIEGFVIRDGKLFFSGCDTVALARDFGTPLWVLSEDLVREKCKKYCDSFRSHTSKFSVAYAGKAFLTTGFCGLLKSEEMGLDVCSAGELHTAKAAGFNMDRVLFHGNNKTRMEISLALRFGVGRFVVDNLHELSLVNQLAKEANLVQPIFFRVTPGITTHTHHYVQTGHLDTKFGFGIDNGQAEEAIRVSAGLQNVKLVGLHCHIGSQLFDLSSFKAAIHIVLEFMAKLREFFPKQGLELDLGGGLGVRYTSEDYPPPIEEYVDTLYMTTQSKTKELGMEMPFLWVEPGRSIVAPAGITLYTVGAIKEIPGIRTFLSVDGSMADHPRTALYGSIYCAVLANKVSEASPDDILAVFCTGAYHYSMSSNYNRLPRPAVVGLSKGKPRLLVRPETFEDLLRHDENPSLERGLETANRGNF